MNEWALVGSAASPEDLKKLIEKRWTWSNIEFRKLIGNVYFVTANGKLCEGVRVLHRGKRYRFERKV